MEKAQTGSLLILVCTCLFHSLFVRSLYFQNEINQKHLSLLIVNNLAVDGQEVPAAWKDNEFLTKVAEHLIANGLNDKLMLAARRGNDSTGDGYIYMEYNLLGWFY